MRRFAIILLLVLAMPLQTSAATVDVHADAATNATANLLTPNNALGEPDQKYTDFLDKDAAVTLRMEQPVTSDLTMYVKVLEFNAGYTIEFMDADMNKTQTRGNKFPMQTPEITVSYTSETPYAFVKIISTNEEVWKLDAVRATVETQEEPEDPVEPEPEPEPEDVLEAGDLIKLTDDSDPTTTHDTAVYVLGEDNKRHAFPNERVFQSWSYGFENVTDVSQETMSTFSLGANVTMRPGSYLVKIQTDPRVYAVEPDSTLRWVKTETIAQTLYGTDWNTRVVDVADVFFHNYTVGEPIDTAVHPTGTLGSTEADEDVYIRNGTYYAMDEPAFTQMRFNHTFQTDIPNDMLELYVDGGSFASTLAPSHPY